ncbi:hypothetical protein EPN18_04885 [bacterium]|nr:MAG: hypothetical protein EPN18_04885 [bacterium]
MAGILIITEKGMASGFKCAGFECAEAEGGDDAAALLTQAEQRKYGLVAIEERLLECVPWALKRRLSKKGLPIIIHLNIPKTWEAHEYGESPVVRLIRRAIGYQIKIRR